MKKKMICLLTIFSLFLTFFAFAPITLKAAEESPVISSNQAVDTSSSQLVDGTGYFKKTDTATTTVEERTTSVSSSIYIAATIGDLSEYALINFLRLVLVA